MHFLLSPVIIYSLQADPLSQVARREYQFCVGLTKLDRHLGCGTMCIVFVQPGSLNSSEQNMLAAAYWHAVYIGISRQQRPTISMTSSGAYCYN